MTAGSAGQVVRVLPDVAAIDKEFDYRVPAGVTIAVGDVVRIDLHGRRVGGWVLAVDVEPAAEVKLRPLARVTGRGPASELIDLAGWAAWRWAGRRANLLRTASPPGVVRWLEPPTSSDPAGDGGAEGGIVAGEPWLLDALAERRAVLRLPPGADRYPLVRACATAPTATEGGRTLVLCPSVTEAQALGRRLSRDGVSTAVVAFDRPGAAAADEWRRAAEGRCRVVVGARAGAWAPVSDLGRVVVLDEHDEAYQQEQAPTWHARDVVAERAERAGAPCLLVSPCPSLTALGWGRLVTVPRTVERQGWPAVEVIDQRQLDPALGPLFSPALVDLVRSDGRVLCVLNRTGRARLLACAACATLARCEVCDAAVHEAVPEPAGPAPAGASFACGRCGAERPTVCLQCAGLRFKALRLGVSRAREELEVLAGRPVGEVTASTDVQDPTVIDAPVLIGTEALLHRVPRADAVAFLDFDQELLSTRYRAAEEAMALLARAARIVQRGRGRRGRLLVQTRSPDDQTLVAARASDPGRLADTERPLRTVVQMPPAAALALVSGQAGEAFMESFGSPEGVAVQGPVDGAWRLRSADHKVLCDALAAAERPPGRLRIEVDPVRA